MDLLSLGIWEPWSTLQKLKGSDAWEENNKVLEAGVNLKPKQIAARIREKFPKPDKFETWGLPVDHKSIQCRSCKIRTGVDGGRGM